MAGSGSTILRRRITATSTVRVSNASPRSCDTANNRSREIGTLGLVTSSASMAYSTVLSTRVTPSLLCRLRVAGTKVNGPIGTSRSNAIGTPGVLLTRRSTARMRASSSRAENGLPR